MQIHKYSRLGWGLGVSDGGHNVPAEKIISRIPRALDHVRRAIPLADETYFLDNSLIDSSFRQVAVIKPGILGMKMDALPEWAERVLGEYL